MLILRKLKRTISHSFADKILRITFNFLYKNKVLINSNKCELNIKNIVLFCYGGMGDIILCFPTIIKLSHYFKVTVFIEKKFSDLTSLLPSNCMFVSYEKGNIFSTLLDFRHKNNLPLLFIQQSPIFELVVFKILLKAKYSIGFIFSHKYIDTINLPKTTKHYPIINKIKGYEIICEEIMRLLKIQPKTSTKYKIPVKFLYPTKFKYDFKYIVISVTKNSEWEMGGIEPKEYARAITHIYEDTKLVPIFLGTKEDFDRINKVTKLIPTGIKYVDLTGKTRINDLVKIILNSKLVIANDNGIHHLSNFLKKTTVTLFNFSSPSVYQWNNKLSIILYKQKYNCMPCISKPNGPWDNVPFKCPFKIRCKDTLTAEDLIVTFNKIKPILLGSK